MTPDRFAAASSSVAINIRRLVIGFIATSLLAATPALAQEPISLSRGLRDFVARSQSGTKPVIVEGPQAEINRLASDYGLTIQKRLPSGAVFTASAGQIEMLGRDRMNAHVSEDSQVIGLMAVTAQTTGASQMWKGLTGNFSGLVGRGVSIVVIDSGVGHHQDLQNRILYSVDFTGEGDGDGYGHGTHVASLIAGSGAGSKIGGNSQYNRHGAGRGHHQPQGSWRRRFGLRVGRHRSDRVVHRQQGALQHPRDQSVARRARGRLL
jgi:subtilisin family serine protease